MGACLSANIDPDSPREHSPSRANDHVTGLPTGGNRPLVAKSVQTWKSDTPMTPEALKRMREEFWDTAPSYSGRAEIWQALRAACEAPSLTLAQAIVDSANMTVPTGKLTDGCYDELGNNYRIPNYCVIEPTNLLPASAPAAGASSTSPTVTDPSSSTSPLLPPSGGGVAGTPNRAAAPIALSASSPSQAPLSTPTTAPTPTTATTPAAPPISITARLSVGKDVKMPGISRDTTVAQIKAAVLAAAESDVGAGGSGARLKVFYLGRLMPDDKTVREIGVAEGGVVQVMVIPSL
ncbi:Ubiquitin domain-containing protein 2 [Geranomyces michiganensis]|nr:Ubiquitin domain-containing protein 2 [Geranomyces michiganensis]